MFVCVQMTVCMTALLIGMNDNGHSNHSPREAEGDIGGALMCVRGDGRGYRGPDTQPPTVRLCIKTRVINHTHTSKTELAQSRFEMDIMVDGTKEERQKGSHVAAPLLKAEA